MRKHPTKNMHFCDPFKLVCHESMVRWHFSISVHISLFPVHISLARVTTGVN